MSSLKTWSFIKTFVQRKLDLQEESFITPAELLDYAEEALRFCEAVIHKLNIEDQYFTAVQPIRLVEGKSEYDLPSNIYAHKIQRLIYNNGTRIFDIPRMRQEKRFETGLLLDQNPPGESYAYMLINQDPRATTQIRLFPKARETSTQVTPTGDLTSGSATISNVSSFTSVATGYFISGASIPSGTRIESYDSDASTITMTQAAVATATTETLTVTEPRMLCWYTRSTVIPTATTDYIDFPEFWGFIAQHMIVSCLKKELGNPRLESEMMRLKEMEQQVVDTLSNMVPDQDDTVEQDLSHYGNSTGGWYEGEG